MNCSAAILHPFARVFDDADILLGQLANAIEVAGGDRTRLDQLPADA
jgi:hypothetical protein